MSKSGRKRVERDGRAATVLVSVHPDVVVDSEGLRRAAAKAGGLRETDVRGVHILRRTVDARRGRVRVNLELALDLPGMPYREPVVVPADLPALHGEPEVAIVGAGPAGMFCALELAKLGVRAAIVERGKPVRPRRHDLAALAKHGVLDPDSNYCFGEGGAGTFSDGKLYTRADKRGDVGDVLRAFVGYGAPHEVLVDARPHIGTNRLPRVITAMREHLEQAGVTFAFSRRAEGLVVRDGRVAGLVLDGGDVLGARAVVLAPGHSARDVQRWLLDAGVALAFKPFAIGVRVEHPQALVDRLQYGALAGHPALGSASYRIVEQACGVGVFSFCMCPGGFIVPAATGLHEQVVNGWSPSSRRGRYANSGFVVEVGAELVAQSGRSPNDPLSGVAFQAELEQRAYEVGGGRFVAPAQRIDDFVARRRSTELPDCSYPRGVVAVELDAVLGPLAAPLRAALTHTGARMPGFVGASGIAVALESRTSSPVRIERDDAGASRSHPGLYPCGEGAGQAGGIMSAALDGIRVARAIAQRFGRLPQDVG